MGNQYSDYTSTKYSNGNLECEIYRKRDKTHRDEDQPAYISYYSNENPKLKKWYKNGIV